MKKFIPILIASLFACWSCDLKDTYTQTNVRDMVNVEKGILFNDYGYVLNPVEDAVGADKWKIEGARFYAVYDILNRDLDIRLKRWKTRKNCPKTPWNLTYRESAEATSTWDLSSPA